MNITAEQWCGLCALTESDLPHEWSPIAWVIRNRVHSKRFPATVERVVLQRAQFSRFNDWRTELEIGGPDLVWDAATTWLRNRRAIHRLADAVEVAREVLAAPADAAPFSERVLYFYSPRSMRPRGAKPAWWDAEMAQTITLPGIPADRFQFGEARWA